MGWGIQKEDGGREVGIGRQPPFPALKANVPRTGTSDSPAENNTLTFTHGWDRKEKETPQVQVQAVSRISQQLMETLSLGPAAHHLSQHANYTHPKMQGKGLGAGSCCQEDGMV